MSWALFIGLAGATELQLEPARQLQRGHAGTVLVATWDGDEPLTAPAPEVVAEGAVVLSVSSTRTPGVWAATVVPQGAGEIRATARLDGVEATRRLPVADALALDLSLPERVSVPLDTTLELALPADATLADLAVDVSEGQVLALEQTPEGPVLRWEADSTEEGARVAWLAVRDSRRPDLQPDWVQLDLVDQAEITLRHQVGSKVVVTVAGTDHGPVTADAQGLVSVTVPVRPGQTRGEVVVTDPFGNVQRSSVSLSRERGPNLAVSAGADLVEGLTPTLHLRASSAAGVPWSGSPPSCEMAGQALPVLELSPGAWIASLPPLDVGGPVQLRAECRLPGTDMREVVRLEQPAGRVSQVVLRAWPEELSTDFPVSQLQAFLQDGQGARMPPEGLSLVAEHGSLQEVERDQETVRADYYGAASQPEDQVHARWIEAPTRASVQVLEVGLLAGQDGLVVRARARDGTGRPVVDAPVEIWAAGELIGQGATGPRGFLEVPVQQVSEPVAVQARSGAATASHVWVPWVTLDKWTEAAPDLEQTVGLSIRAGRIRKAELSVDRTLLLTGKGETATLVVVLLDSADVPVVDEPVRLVASQGLVTELHARADGSLFALYAPPPQLRAGEVTVRLESLDGSFKPQELLLELQPAPVERALAVQVGALSNLTTLHSPLLGLHVEQRLPVVFQTNVRLSGEIYWDRRTLNDGSAKVDLAMEVLPLTLSVNRRWDKGLSGTWVGGGLVVAPYRARSWFSDVAQDAPGREELGVHRPGFSLYAGRGLRLRAGELYLEARYVNLGSRATDYTGQVGGLAFAGGFRIVY